MLCTKGRVESLMCTNSSSNMFSMLNPEIAADAAPAKTSQPLSQKTSVDLGQSGAAEPPPKATCILCHVTRSCGHTVQDCPHGRMFCVTEVDGGSEIYGMSLLAAISCATVY